MHEIIFIDNNINSIENNTIYEKIDIRIEVIKDIL